MIQDILTEKYFIFVCLQTAQRVFTGMVEESGHFQGKIITQDHLIGRDTLLCWAPLTPS